MSYEPGNSQNKDGKGYSKKLHYLVIFLLGLILIGVGNMVIDERKLLGIFIVEIGVAFIIALIVIFTIEKYQREHQDAFIEQYIQKISKQLFNAAYNKMVPDVVLNEFIQCLAFSDVIRKEHEITYIIEPCEGHPNNVICTAISIYKLENITTGDIKAQPITMFLEKPLDPELNQHCKVQSISIGNKTYSAQEIAENTTENEQNFSFVVNVLIPRGECVRVNAKASLVKQIEDAENWELKHPSDGIRVAVQANSKLNLKLHARARHSRPLGVRLNEENQKSWELNHGILPHQSISIWWSKKIDRII